jgi:6-carboxyhexanoate--CoA ligase
MNNLWSIRMRAAKTVKSQRSKVKSKNSELTEIHISGAEGLYRKSEILEVVQRYIERALNHSRGKADRIIITIEDIKQKPKTITALPVVTIEDTTSHKGNKIAEQLLQTSGISKTAIDRSFQLIKKNGMRGAALITAEKGGRLEPDRQRGIRVSRLGITKPALKELSLKLSKHNINTETVQEALILASKVSSCEHVIAELCVSDDPDYTTGYVASRDFGYVRIPYIKNKESKSGGRAFFIKEGIDIGNVIKYLERMPVMISKVSSCKGIATIDGILNRPHL